MKRGGGKKKGSRFERTVCRLFSIWWSEGKSGEIFWRSGGSGSMGKLSGSAVHRGDIVQVQTEIGDKVNENKIMVKAFPGCIECKHYAFVDPWKKNNKIFVWMKKLIREEASPDQVPVLVFKQNQRDIFVVFPTVDLPWPFTDPRNYRIFLEKRLFYLVPLSQFFKYITPEGFCQIHDLWVAVNK